MNNFQVKSPCYFMCKIQDIPAIGHENWRWKQTGFYGAEVYVFANASNRNDIIKEVKRYTGLMPNSVINLDTKIELLYKFSPLRKGGNIGGGKKG